VRPNSIHNLGPNSRESSPRHVVVIDTETRWSAHAAGQIHRMRLWEGLTVRRGDQHRSRPRRENAGGTTAQQLAAWLDAQVKTSPPVWVYAHNLSFDGATSRLPVELRALGWQVTQHSLASDSPWAMLRQGNRTMRLVDSASLLPVGVAVLGQLYGQQKLPLPNQDDDDEVWRARCRVDVEITMRALIELMDWWDSNQLGHWSVTGPRTGWNAMRHRCVRRPGMAPIVHRGPAGSSFVQHGDGHVVIDPDPDARAFERDTLYQGRRDAFRVGVQPVGDYVELDMARAHLTAAQSFRLPCRRGVAFESLEVDSPYLMGQNMAVIARCVVDVASPRYPLRTRYGIVHPVGRFETVLAGPELADARERGELVKVMGGYFYRLSYHMQPWADWAAGVLDAPADQVPPAARVAVKAWSRSVPGTWAARTSRVILEGSSPVDGWSATHGIQAGTGKPCSIVHLGGRMQILARDQEGDDAFSAVLSFIQSYVRVALNQVIDAVEPWRLVTCSTDSVLVDVTGAGERPGGGLPLLVWGESPAARAGKLAAALSKFCDPFVMRVKQRATRVDVLSPQHIRLDGVRRYSGVPGGDVEVGKDQFAFLTWPKLGRQMEMGDTGGYVRELRTVDLRGVTVARYVAGCGCTAPPRAGMLEDGSTVLLAPAGWGCYRHRQPWEDRQWPGLPMD
jgi:hypothetical protein